MTESSRTPAGAIPALRKLLNPAQLASLAVHCGHKHVTRERFADDESAEKWVADGRPAVWLIEEESRDGWACALDSGYGLLALFKGDRCLGVGKYSAQADPPEVIALDCDYYGLRNYLWRPVNETTGLAEARPAR